MSESFVIGREQCPKCAAEGHDNSQDNLAKYNDGHCYCFRCKYYIKGNNVQVTKRHTMGEWKALHGKYMSLPDRRLNEETLRKFSYEVIDNYEKGEVHIANFYSKGVLIAQKYRGPDKTFKWRGESRNAGLFGQHLFDGSNSRRLVITEGEIDAMSVYQANGGWPVVSLNGGVGNVEKNIKDNLEWLCRFPEIILMFDCDDAGREATAKAASLLPPGRCKIATLPYKDANECLLNNDTKAIMTATFNARLYSPDEIVHVSEIEEDEESRNQKVWDFPWDDMTDGLIGQRSGEITMWVSGTGSGKSTIMRENAMHHLAAGRGVGMIMLEESMYETKEDMISLMINAPVRQIRAREVLNKLRREQGREELTGHKTFEASDYEEAKATLNAMPLHIYNHMGNSAYANALARMEFMAVSLGVEVIILDHITALAAGLMGSKESLDERQMMDQVMKDLRSLVQRTGVHIDIVSQLKKTMKSYEEGDPISMEDIRGSGSLGSVPNVIIAMERNRQDPDSFQANCTAIKVLKNRLDGRCNYVCGLYYDHFDGRMEEVKHRSIQQDDGTYRSLFKRKEMT